MTGTSGPAAADETGIGGTVRDGWARGHRKKGRVFE